MARKRLCHRRKEWRPSKFRGKLEMMPCTMTCVPTRNSLLSKSITAKELYRNGFSRSYSNRPRKSSRKCSRQTADQGQTCLTQPLQIPKRWYYRSMSVHLLYKLISLKLVRVLMARRHLISHCMKYGRPMWSPCFGSRYVRWSAATCVVITSSALSFLFLNQR